MGKDPQDPEGPTYATVRCRKCGLIYTHPRPTAEELGQHYQDEYYLRPLPQVSKAYHWLNKFFLAQRLKRVEQHKVAGKILDVGCGDGSFLRELAPHGWECWGLETSIWGAQRARTNSQLRIVYGEFSQANFPRGFFDVVTLWQALEHVAEPLPLLQEIWQILKDDGVLIVSVPNIDSWQARISRAKWFHLDLPRHLVHFTPESLNTMIRAAGFRPIGYTHWSLEYGAPAFLQSLLNMTRATPNLLYNLVKRAQRPPKSVGSMKSVFSTTVTMLGIPTLLLPAIGLSLLESSLGHGATIEVHAVKDERQPLLEETG